MAKRRKGNECSECNELVAFIRIRSLSLSTGLSCLSSLSLSLALSLSLTVSTAVLGLSLSHTVWTTCWTHTASSSLWCLINTLPGRGLTDFCSFFFIWTNKRMACVSLSLSTREELCFPLPTPSFVHYFSDFKTFHTLSPLTFRHTFLINKVTIGSPTLGLSRLFFFVVVVVSSSLSVKKKGRKSLNFVVPLGPLKAFQRSLFWNVPSFSFVCWSSSTLSCWRFPLRYFSSMKRPPCVCRGDERWTKHQQPRKDKK